MDIYIARTCQKAGDDATRIFAERAFGDYAAALAYLEREFFDVGDTWRQRYYGEIVSHLDADDSGGDNGGRVTSDCYDASGSLICKRQLHPPAERETVFMTPGFVPVYAVGDIVTIAGPGPFGDKISVVRGLPPVWGATQDLSELPDDAEMQLEAAYLVESLSDRGYLRHSHVYEYEMSLFAGELPPEQQALGMLARHYRGEELIPQKKLALIDQGSVCLAPLKHLSDIGLKLPLAPPKYTVTALYSPQLLAVYEQGVGLLLYDMHSGRQQLLSRMYNFTETGVSLYCHAPYICAVENFGTNGLVINVDTGEELKLTRGDYHAERCSYPIGFVMRGGELLLVHGTDWNRLDLTRLSDFTLLTSREVTAENGINYFYSKLTVSPGGGHFVAEGWVWSPMEAIEVFSVERFFTEYDKASTALESPEQMSGYNWDRPICWVDEHTVAIGHNPNEGNCGEARVPSQVLLYDISRTTQQQYQFVREDGTVDSEGSWTHHPLTGSIPFDGFAMYDDGGSCYYEVGGELYYDSVKSCFIGLNSDTGLLITGRDGNILHADPTFTDWDYSPEFRMFYRFTPQPYAAEVRPLDGIV